jgi:hypothetical protein
VRAASSSALDHVARALHSIVERLDGQDRFALVACAEEAILLTRSTSGANRVELVRGISRLKGLNLGEQTDLAHGIELGLNELRRGRDAQMVPERAERLLLLTDGFTQRPETCLQEDVLTGLADRSTGRALFLRRPEDIPRAIAAELLAARAVAARNITLSATPASGTTLRRITQIRPSLTALMPINSQQHGYGPASVPATPSDRIEIRLGDIEAGAPIALLVELLAPPHQPGPSSLGRLAVLADGVLAAEIDLPASYEYQTPSAPPDVLDAAARANAARLQQRATEAAAHGASPEAARLFRAAAARLDDLGERALAEVARTQATALEQTGQANPLATKELTYATRRLGGS